MTSEPMNDFVSNVRVSLKPKMEKLQNTFDGKADNVYKSLKSGMASIEKSFDSIVSGASKKIVEIDNADVTNYKWTIGNDGRVRLSLQFDVRIYLTYENATIYKTGVDVYA